MFVSFRMGFRTGCLPAWPTIGNVGVAWQQMSGASSALSFYGTIEARNIEVGSKEGGRIAEVLVHEGDAIAKDTVN